MDAKMIVARNLQVLMDWAYDNDKPGATQLWFGEKGVVAQATIGRILRRQTGVKVDHLERIAKVYGLPAYALLVPDLDPADLPVAISRRAHDAQVKAGVKELYDAMQAHLASLGGGPSVSDPFYGVPLPSRVTKKGA